MDAENFTMSSLPVQLHRRPSAERMARRMLSMLLCSALLSSCLDARQENVTPGAETPQSDLAMLARLIQLNFQPISAQWLTEPMVSASGSALGPSDWQLIALLEFDEATLSRVKRTLTLQTAPTDLHVRADFVRAWFPEALRARFQRDDSSGNLIWRGERYQPTPFLKAPLTAGFVLIAAPYVLIVLHTL